MSIAEVGGTRPYVSIAEVQIQDQRKSEKSKSPLVSSIREYLVTALPGCNQVTLRIEPELA